MSNLFGLKTTDKKVILGSASPRRKQLLSMMDAEFTQTSIDAEEVIDASWPIDKIAEELAIQKSDAYSSLSDDELLITADTIVVLQDKLLLKPTSIEEAAAMLLRLSGRTHEVHTGVCIRSGQRSRSFSEKSLVYFARLSNTEIEYYSEIYEPLDKAGAYGIQEWIGGVAVEKIEGCFYNIMGLPLSRLYKEMNLFIDQ